MKEPKLYIGEPLDRTYFKQKADPKVKKGPQLTKCCQQDIDRKGLNKNNKKDWELIEDHIEEQLHMHSSTESITPICCKVCGRFLRYHSELNNKAWNKEYGKTS